MKTNNNTKQKANKNPFNSVEVQLALLTEKIPKGENWAFEIKYDGYRIVAFVENGKVRLVTRNGKDYTKKFEDIAKVLENKFKKECVVLDGEMVAFDKNGRSDFGQLQKNLKSGVNNCSYVVFDVLAYNGKDLRNEQLKERKRVLENIFKTTPKNVILSKFSINNGEKCFKIAKKLNLEGVVAKNMEATYCGERNGDWLKIKCYHRQEFVVCGYCSSEKNKQLSAILLGYYQGNNLIFRKYAKANDFGICKIKSFKMSI